MKKTRRRATCCMVVLFVVLVVLGVVESSAKDCGTWIPLAGTDQIEPAEVLLLSPRGDKTPEVAVTFPGVIESKIEAPDGTLYSQFAVPNAGSDAVDIGTPELPAKGFFLEIPYGVTPSLEILDQLEFSLGTNYLIYPRQPLTFDSDMFDNPPFTIDEEFYAKERFYPDVPVELGISGALRGHRVVYVKVYPLRYNPASGEVRAVASVRLRLSYKGTPDPQGEAKKKRVAAREFEKIAASLILNYVPVEKNFKEPWKMDSGNEAETEAEAKTLEGDELKGLSTGNAADYLIIVADSFYEETLPLAEWKHMKGFITRMTKLSEIGTAPTATDVKNYIQNAYDTWNPAPTYVLLVGDKDDVPSFDYQSAASDHPYSCLDGSDWLPDVTLGRLTVSLEADCTNVVNKILKYDRTPVTGMWYDDFLGAAFFHNIYSPYLTTDRWYVETIMTIYKYITEEAGFDGHTALCPDSFQSEYHFNSNHYHSHRCEFNQVRWDLTPPTCYPDPVPQWIVDRFTSKEQAHQDVIDTINAGTGLVMHRDHGGNTGWSYPSFTVSDMQYLTNGDKTPMVYSLNCYTGSFHYTVGDCFCEAMLKKYPGGCVGIVGATKASYTVLNELFGHGITDCFFPNYDPFFSDQTYESTWRTAGAFNHGRYYFSSYRNFDSMAEYQTRIYHYFGDPELMLRTASPSTLSVTHPSQVMSGQPVNVTVTVKIGTTPVEDALVCISHPTASDYWNGYTNSNGQITFSDITFTQTGDYDIVASAFNADPYEGTITAVACPDECEWAKVLSNGATEYFGTYMNQATMSAEPFPPCANPGSGDVDIWYKIQPGTSKLVTVELEADLPAGFVVYSGSCNDLTVIGCNEGDPMKEIGILQFATDNSQSLTYYIRLYGMSYTGGVLTVDWIDAPPGKYCLNPQPAECGDVFDWENMIPGVGTDRVPCFGASTAQGRWLEINVPPQTASTVTLIDYDFMYLVGIGFYDDCGSSPFDSICESDGEVSLTYENSTFDPITIKVLTNVHQYANPPEISVSCSAVNDEPCDAAELSCDQTIEGDLTRYATAGTASSCGWTTKDVWYYVDVPYANTTVQASFYHGITSGYVAIYSGTCGNLYERACGLSISYSTPAQCSWNTQYKNQRIWVKAASEYYMSQSLTITCTLPDGATCGKPKVVQCGETYDPSNQIPGMGTDELPCMSSVQQENGARWLQLSVPAETAATVTVWDWDIMQYVGIGFYASCGDYPNNLIDSVCNWEGAQLRYENPTASPVTLKVLVNHHQSAIHPEIWIDCETVKWGQTCISAKEVQCGETYGTSNQIPGMGDDVLPCMEGLGEPLGARWLDLTIPSEKAATITVHDWDLQYMVGIGFYESCDDYPNNLIDSVCDWEGAQLRYENPTASPVTLKVLVNHHQYAYHPEITIECETVKYGMTCISAQPAQCGDVYDWNNRIPGYGDDKIPCFGSSYLQGRWLSLTVPAETAATVQLTDYDFFYLVGIGFYSDCSQTTPFDSACDDDGIVSLTYENPATQPVVIKVLTNVYGPANPPEIAISCAPIVPDTCQTAELASCNYYYDEGDMSGCTDTDESSCTETFFFLDRWYEIQPPSGYIVDIWLYSENAAPSVTVFKGSCASLTEVTCDGPYDYGIPVFAEFLSDGSTYYIMCETDPDTGQSADYELEIMCDEK